MIGIDELNRVIARSEEFENELSQLLASSSFADNNKSTAMLAMSDIAQEHATSLRSSPEFDCLHLLWGCYDFSMRLSLK